MTEVAKAYGTMLYELAEESGGVEQMLEEITALREAFEENPQFLTLLCTTKLRRQERVAIVDESFGGKLHRYLLNFLKIIAENGTAREFPDAARQFRREYNWRHGIETVRVISAVPLSAAQEAQLADKLAGLTGKTIHLEKKLDPACIGGLRIQMDGVQLDGTVSNKLDAIRSRLLRTLA